MQKRSLRSFQASNSIVYNCVVLKHYLDELSSDPNRHIFKGKGTQVRLIPRLKFKRKNKTKPPFWVLRELRI